MHLFKKLYNKMWIILFDLSKKRIHNGNRGKIGVICVVSSLSYHEMNFCSLSKIEIHKNVRWCSNKIWKDREYNETQNIINEFLTHFNEYSWRNKRLLLLWHAIHWCEIIFDVIQNAFVIQRSLSLL